MTTAITTLKIKKVFFRFINKPEFDEHIKRHKKHMHQLKEHAKEQEEKITGLEEEIERLNARIIELIGQQK